VELRAAAGHDYYSALNQRDRRWVAAYPRPRDDSPSRSATPPADAFGTLVSERDLERRNRIEGESCSPGDVIVTWISLYGGHF
jgi:hypothetical protein